MQTLLITLVGPQKRLDLQVPGDMILSDLLPALLELCIPSTTDTAKETQRTTSLSAEALVLRVFAS